MTELLNQITTLSTADIAAPIGFHADGKHVGLKHKSKDLGWIYSDVIASVAGVFTTNQVQAAPVQLDKKRFEMVNCKPLLLILEMLMLSPVALVCHMRNLCKSLLHNN